MASRTSNRKTSLSASMAAIVASLVFVASALALPDGRNYELVSPVEKNGLAPYAAVPSSTGDAVDFQARGALAGATWGSLNLYQATRTATGWETVPLTPTPAAPLRPLEEQAPVWNSSDLSRTIFATPQSFDPGDNDNGALSLYEQTPSGLEWVSHGTQSAAEPDPTTFDTATPDGTQVVFSTAASLVPAAFGLDPEIAPDPEFLYERDTSDGVTTLLSLDAANRPVGYAQSTLAEEYHAEFGYLPVVSVEGFLPGQFVTVGTGSSAETAQIVKILLVNGKFTLAIFREGKYFPHSWPTGTPVVQSAVGAVAGDGGHLADSPPPAREVLPANAGSGSTTNAISSNGAKVFFEAPNPSAGEPVGLYMRENGSTTKIAGAARYSTKVTGTFGEESAVVGSARFEGAAADGSLMFFNSEEGLAGATKGRELYQFNTTSHAIGGLTPLSVGPISSALNGDQAPSTTLAAAAGNEGRITVASTVGFHAGEEILFGPFEALPEQINADETDVIASVDSATELTLAGSLSGVGFGIPAGDEVHSVHPAFVVAIANDGSHVFFESNGVLAANKNTSGAMAVLAEPNLYVFDTNTGDTSFIGTLASSDVEDTNGNPSGLVGEPDISRPAVPSPDGDVLVFASVANLTGQNPWQEFTEIYRYRVAGDSLVCVSCTAPGVRPTGDATFGETAGGTYDPPGLTSPMSKDGLGVFFQTPDSLVPEDFNGDAPLSPKFGTATSTDVYEWEAGKISLISSGAASTPAVLMGTTPSGDDVLFTTTAQLVPDEGDGGYENVFDARVGGGFPDPAQAAPSCSGALCRATFGVAPVPVAQASTALQGPESASGVLGSKGTKAKPKSPACGKGHVRRRVKGKVVCARKARKAARRVPGAHGSR